MAGCLEDMSLSPQFLSPEQLLRGAGLRVTRPRTAVITALQAAPHSGADAVLSAVRSAAGSVSTQAVYDVLNVLADRGLVRRIQPAGSVARYELRTGDNHHHVVCRRCGTVGDVDCVLGEAPCLDTTDDRGFVIDEAEVTYWGLCPHCQTNDPTTDQHQGAHHA
jgi:Fe2+ or Zn2+ uptake regulation protein